MTFPVLTQLLPTLCPLQVSMQGVCWGVYRQGNRKVWCETCSCGSFGSSQVTASRHQSGGCFGRFFNGTFVHKCDQGVCSVIYNNLREKKIWTQYPLAGFFPELSTASQTPHLIDLLPNELHLVAFLLLDKLNARKFACASSKNAINFFKHTISAKSSTSV